MSIPSAPSEGVSVVNSNPRVNAYLQRFDAEARVLQLDSRSVLRQGLVQHISDSIAADQSDKNVEKTLKELGDPREIVRDEAQNLGNVDNSPKAKAIAGGIGLFVLAVLGVILAALSLIGILWVIFAGPGPIWLLIFSIIFIFLGPVITILSLRRLKRRPAN